MKVVCVGGGPAGLYLAINLRRSRPDLEVQILERNDLGDAYGFGVVFSDETLTRLEHADPESYDEISRSFRRWGEIEVRTPGGENLVSGGHGFAAISRKRLLEILELRALDLGADVAHGVEVTVRPDADLVVGADGISSRVRKGIEPQARPSLTTHRNKYVWFGTPHPFDRFTFIFLETSVGRIWAHVYPYDDHTSTFIVEAAPKTWEQLGFSSIELPPGTSDLRSLQACADLFADHLGGDGLLGNNSKWLEFTTLRCDRWSSERTVLVGDAAHTAHFSVGSGTKLAMEDAVALAESLTKNRQIDVALAEYERVRRPEVASLQRAASASRQWFEGVDRYADLDPRQFAFSLLTRSQRITYDNLRQRDPQFMERIDDWYAASGHGAPVKPSVPPMFHPFTVGGLTLRNRIVVSPMAQYTAIDGMPNDWHLVHLGSRAVGGAGLVLTEMTCVSPEGRISYGCTGLWNEEQREAWKRIVDFAHEHTSAAIGLQVGHAGRKGSTKRMWEGDTDPLEDGNWPLIAPSPLSYRPDSQIPKEMNRQDMDEVREQHVRSAVLGEGAGFDWLELHFAHGYLVSSFLSPLSNIRADEYGGSLENRMRYPLEVFDAVRAVWKAPISVRISATDWVDTGFDGDQAVEFARALKNRGCDVIDVSTGQTSVEARPEYGRLYQTPYSDRIRHEVGIPTMTVGGVSSIDDVHNILVAGRADLCVIARPHLLDPYWTLNAAIDLGYVDHPWPVQYLSARGSRRREQGAIPPDVFRS